MPVRFNYKLLLWSLGVLQPASASQVRDFLLNVFKDISSFPSAEEIKVQFDRWNKEKLIVRVFKKNQFYSLTHQGNQALPTKLRRHKDKTRLFLLKKARSSRMSASGGQKKELAGDAPAMDGSSKTQDQRPINASATRSRKKSRAPISRAYWPLISKQLTFLAGPTKCSPDLFFRYYSFPALKSLHAASVPPKNHKDLNLHNLALAIGISPRLITSFIHAPTRHYRSFKIGKRGGGVRIIHSPRLFLKTVQYWILDYLLFFLKAHPCCHSYQKGKSILTNANQHVGKKYVATIDIKNYFGSINIDAVRALLIKNGLGEEISNLISKLVTFNNALPQGVPTSPIISNSFLYDFDEISMKFAKEKGLSYSRYSDDITVSGDNKEEIKKYLGNMRERLKLLNLSVNEEKVRIASKGGQQCVTGLVVNVSAAPPRKFRRMVRAMFHNAKSDPERIKSKINELRGYLSYLNSFPLLSKRREINEYREIISVIATR